MDAGTLHTRLRDMTSERTGESSSQIRARVLAARQCQHARIAARPRITCNARMGSRELKGHRQLKAETLELLKMAMTEKKRCARAFDRILKVSRTIADLAGSETMASEHVMEAVQFRVLDQQIWT